MLPASSSQVTVIKNVKSQIVSLPSSLRCHLGVPFGFSLMRWICSSLLTGTPLMSAATVRTRRHAEGSARKIVRRGDDHRVARSLLHWMQFPLPAGRRRYHEALRIIGGVEHHHDLLERRIEIIADQIRQRHHNQALNLGRACIVERHPVLDVSRGRQAEQRRAVPYLEDLDGSPDRSAALWLLPSKARAGLSAGSLQMWSTVSSMRRSRSVLLSMVWVSVSCHGSQPVVLPTALFIPLRDRSPVQSLRSAYPNLSMIGPYANCGRRWVLPPEARAVAPF